MKLDEFILAEARRRMPYVREHPQGVETEMMLAMRALGVEVVRYAREHADVHYRRITEDGAVSALQAFADGISLSLSKLPRPR